ncbi:MAG: flippase-like domain-containing protein [Oscillospiraceae bacterium]|jgi:uncharacterized membrane protein YbhN (UPF0104 family)|nr:flippase-like domain-containing protein [Oscillospiraceae bacterium]
MKATLRGHGRAEPRLRTAWRVLRPALSLVAGCALLAWVLSGVQWAQLRASLQSMRLWVLLVAFALLLGNDFFLAVKCYLLRPDLPFWRAYCAFLGMRFFSLLPGGNVTGEAARLLALRELAGAQAATAMVLMDKQTHMIPAQVYCILGLLLASIPMPAPLVWLAVWSLLWPLLAPGVLFIPRVRRFALTALAGLQRWRMGAALYRQLQTLCESCTGLAGHPRQLAAHLVCGFLGEGCCIATQALLAWRLGIAVPLADWLWINSMMLLAMVLPLSVMGMGVREGAMVLLLGWFGISRSLAMSLPLLISSLTLIKGVAAGLVVTLDKRRRLSSHTKER